MKKNETQEEYSNRLKYESEYRTRLFEYVRKQAELGTITSTVQIWFNFILNWFDVYEKMKLKSDQKGKRKKLKI